MKANKRSRKSVKSNDEGVSPVIAVILMVAITVVLAATVYVWVSGFASDDSGPEQASATARGFASDGSSTDWIRVTLVRGESAPYDQTQVSATALAPNGDSKEILCTSAKGAWAGCTDNFFSSGNDWDVGEVLYVPCQAKGDHAVTISVKGTTILDTTVKCDTNA